MISYEWWAVGENIGDTTHLSGMDRRENERPALFRTKKEADRDIAHWKREDARARTWGLKAVKVTVRIKEG